MKNSVYNCIVRFRLLWRVFSRYGFNLKTFRLFWAVQPYTMVGHARLLNTYDLAMLAEDNKIDGAFVECGVWRGGCAAIMAAVVKKNGAKRNVWLFDSFEGMPEPTVKDGAKAVSLANQRVAGRLTPINVSVGFLQDVEKLLFQILNLSRDYIHIIKGWFQNTLSREKENIGSIAILRLDADWYESTRCILDNLYDSIVSGGYIIVDDYGSFEGCRKAVDEFLAERNFCGKLFKIDASGIYFQKP